MKGILGKDLLGLEQLTAEQIKPAPPLNTGVSGHCIIGIAAVKAGPGDAGSGGEGPRSPAAAGHERMLILMDIEALMSSAEMGLNMS